VGESPSIINYYYKEGGINIQWWGRGKKLFNNDYSNDTFEYYQKPIKKILKDKNVISKIPSIMLPDFP